MRDALLLLVILMALGVTLRHPFVGIITWAWFTVMTPHQLAYGTYGIPLNLLIAAVTIGALIMHGGLGGRIDHSGQRGGQRGDQKSASPHANQGGNQGASGGAMSIGNTSIGATGVGIGVLPVMLIIFSFWLFVSQQFSLDAANSAEYFDRFIKTMAFALICALTVTTKLRLHALLWTVVVSLGFFAAKGALFTVATLGQYRVQGVPTTVLEDNNHMGIALATLLPLLLYLRGEVRKPVLRFALTALFVMTMISILGTHSRGAFLALVAFAAYFWSRSRHKVSIVLALMIVLIPAVAFMPAKWTERMATIGEATQDASFMGRVDAWVINTKLALANPVTGAGLRNSYEKDIAKEVDRDRADSAKAAHSIYFEILGGSGFVGLALYVLLIAAAFFSAQMVMWRARTTRAPPWQARLALYAQISLAVFCVGGASVSLEMWDGYWLIIAMIAALSTISRQSPYSSITRTGRPLR